MDPARVDELGFDGGPSTGRSPRGTWWKFSSSSVNGHRFLPSYGHRNSPLADTLSPRWRPSVLPSVLSTRSRARRARRAAIRGGPRAGPGGATRSPCAEVPVHPSTGRSPRGTWWSVRSSTAGAAHGSLLRGGPRGGPGGWDQQLWSWDMAFKPSTGRSPRGTWWLAITHALEVCEGIPSTGRSPRGTWWSIRQMRPGELAELLLRGGPRGGPGGLSIPDACQRGTSSFYGEVPEGDLVVRAHASGGALVEELLRGGPRGGPGGGARVVPGQRVKAGLLRGGPRGGPGGGLRFRWAVREVAASTGRSPRGTWWREH